MKQKTQSRRLPKNRRPTSPGEMLQHEFLVPMQLTQTELAEKMQVPVNRVSQIINEKRAMTADTALRLEMVLGMSAVFWLGLQQDLDLFEAKKKLPKTIKRIRL